MAQWESWYWRGYNIMMRLVGLAFLFWGLGFACWGLWLALHPNTPFPVNGVPTTALGPKLGMTLAAAVMAAPGIFLIRTRPYRPDLGDVPYLFDPFLAKTQVRSNRHWWTGDEMQSSVRADA
jgi:hypothetical protein